MTDQQAAQTDTGARVHFTCPTCNLDHDNRPDNYSVMVCRCGQDLLPSFHAALRATTPATAAGRRCPVCIAYNAHGQRTCENCAGSAWVTATPATAGAREDEQLSAMMTNAYTLLSRLRSRSRAETFYPGSIAPELLRRSEECLEGLTDAINAYRAAPPAQPAGGESAAVERLRKWTLQFQPEVTCPVGTGPDPHDITALLALLGRPQQHQEKPQ